MPGSRRLTLSNSICLASGGRNSAPTTWPTSPRRSRNLKTFSADSRPRRSESPRFQPALHRPVQADQGRAQRHQAGHGQLARQHEDAGHEQQQQRAQQAQQDQQRLVDRFAAEADQLHARIARQLPLDAVLVELLHQVALDQAHEHEAFADDGQVFGGLVRGLPAMAAEVGRHLPADQPDQDGEHQERQRQPELDRQGEGEQQSELDRVAEVDGQAGEQGVVDRLDVAREDADGLGWPQRAEGQRAQPEGVVIDGAAQRVAASMVARAAISRISSIRAAPRTPRMMPISSRPIRYGDTAPAAVGVARPRSRAGHRGHDRGDDAPFRMQAHEKTGNAQIDIVIDQVGILGRVEPQLRHEGIADLGAPRTRWSSRDSV